MDEYTEMTMKQLRELAYERRVDLGNARKKVDVIAILNSHDDEGAPFRNEEYEPTKPEPTGKKVAIYLTRNIDFRKHDLGVQKRGYKIVDESELDFWLQWPELIRLATPQEVADYYGV